MQENINKEFKLSTWSINNKMTVFVIIFIILIGGYQSYKSMPREAFPEVVIPQIFITTTYPGNSAIDIEKLIIRPLEQEKRLQNVWGEINESAPKITISFFA